MASLLERKNNQIVQVDWNIIYADYKKGKTLQEIGKELNCSYVCVRNNFKKLGLKIRTLSEANFLSSKLKKGTHGKTRKMIKINSKRFLLSHYIWSKNNGMLSVPQNCIIHHRDFNRQNNEINNLVMLPKSWHTELHNKYELLNDPNRKYWGINKQGGD